MTHVLKSWVEWYSKIKYGELTANIRKDDRPFQDNDDVIFEEFDPQLKIYTGHTCKAKIVTVQRNVPGLMPGYCVMSIKIYLDACKFVVEKAGLPENRQ